MLKGEGKERMFIFFSKETISKLYATEMEHQRVEGELERFKEYAVNRDRLQKAGTVLKHVCTVCVLVFAVLACEVRYIVEMLITREETLITRTYLVTYKRNYNPFNSEIGFSVRYALQDIAIVNEDIRPNPNPELSRAMIRAYHYIHPVQNCN